MNKREKIKLKKSCELYSLAPASKDPHDFSYLTGVAIKYLFNPCFAFHSSFSRFFRHFFCAILSSFNNKKEINTRLCDGVVLSEC